MDERMRTFLASEAFGVVGASTDRSKFGNKVLRCYLQHGKKAIPVHPRESQVEGIPAVKSVSELPPEAASISVITPPAITEKVVEEAIARGIRNIWMQPGAQSAKAVETCRAHGVNVIGDGSCLLVELGCH